MKPHNLLTLKNLIKFNWILEYNDKQNSNATEIQCTVRDYTSTCSWIFFHLEILKTIKLKLPSQIYFVKIWLPDIPHKGV